MSRSGVQTPIRGVMELGATPSATIDTIRNLIFSDPSTRFGVTRGPIADRPHVKPDTTESSDYA
jgi:hypothetical protein